MVLPVDLEQRWPQGMIQTLAGAVCLRSAPLMLYRNASKKPKSCLTWHHFTRVT